MKMLNRIFNPARTGSDWRVARVGQEIHLLTPGIPKVPHLNLVAWDGEQDSLWSIWNAALHTEWPDWGAEAKNNPYSHFATAVRGFASMVEKTRKRVAEHAQPGASASTFVAWQVIPLDAPSCLVNVLATSLPEEGKPPGLSQPHLGCQIIHQPSGVLLEMFRTYDATRKRPKALGNDKAKTLALPAPASHDHSPDDHTLALSEPKGILSRLLGGLFK